MADVESLGAAAIGLGVGRSHLANYQALPGVRPVAACDIDEAKLEAAQKEFGLARVYTDYTELASDPEVNLVSVCTPDHLHAEHALAMLEGGKHVLVEKPMCTSVDDAVLLVAKVRETGLKLAVGNVNRFVPQFAAMHKLVGEGRIGDLFHVEADYIHDCHGLYQATPWRADPENPQCVVLGGAVHPLDLMRWLAGEIEEVFAYCNKKTLPEFPLPDNYVSVVKFASGCTGKCQVTTGVRRRPAHLVNLTALGVNGTVMSNLDDSELLLYVEGEIPGQTDFARIRVEAVHGHPFRRELEHFVDCIRSDQEPMVNVVEGAKTVSALCAIVQSARTGKAIQVRGDF